MKKKENAHLVVEYKGRGMTLNSQLIEQQKVSEAGIAKLKELHLERMMLEDEMSNTDDPVRLHVMAQEREHIEFRLQRVWGFPENSDYHRWWEVPKCVCPWMDNSDNYPTKYRIVRGDCPVHGTLPKKKNFFQKIIDFFRKISIEIQ